VRRWLDDVSTLARTIVAVVIGIFLAIAVLTVVSSAPGHDELFERQMVIENQLRYVSCLLLIPPDEQTPEAVAACQVSPEGGG
jgi:hypothetical protein